MKMLGLVIGSVIGLCLGLGLVVFMMYYTPTPDYEAVEESVVMPPTQATVPDDSALKQAFAIGFNTGADYGAEALNVLRDEAVRQGKEKATVSRADLRKVAAQIYLRNIEKARKDGVVDAKTDD